MLRFGLIGCGLHAQWALIPALGGNAKKAKLAAIADIDEGRLQAVGDVGAAKYADYRQMLAREKPDAVYVATLPDTHAAIAVEALEAGCHVVCEKPMALTVDECRRVIDAAEGAGRRLAVTFESRYYPVNQKIRQWIAEGRLGHVEAVHLQSLWDGHKSFSRVAARRRRLMQLSGGLDCGVHKADLARFWCGGDPSINPGSRGDWQEIQARGAWLGEDISPPPHVSVLARLDSGVVVSLNASMTYTGHIEPKAMVESACIVGGEGVIQYFHQVPDGPEAAARTASLVHLVSRTLQEQVPLVEADHAQAIAWLVDDFADAVAGRPHSPHLPTGHDGLMAQMFVEQANRSARGLQTRYTAFGASASTRAR